MPRRDDIDDEIDEGPTPEDIAHFDSATRTCPACKEEVYDDAEVCWKCGHAMSAAEDTKSPVWIIVTAVIALGALLFILIR